MKEVFNDIITKTVKPLLKANNFTKKGLNFYRRKDDLIFLLNFQNSQGNSFEQYRFYINCGIHSTCIDKVIGKNELSEPKEYQCYFHQRISSIIDTDDSYCITAETDIRQFALYLSDNLQAVVNLFNTVRLTNDLITLMIAENGLNNYKELFEYLLLSENNEGLKKYLSNLYFLFGEDHRWKLFENNLNNLLIKHSYGKTVQDILNE